ncbi:sensor histidine kinase [Helicovermis profundi]|uniref:histidine kinase n=1 Tax=Helicovermis profundi TaxID=3065157 RepID=A0AAU9EKR2_9FIRM|nr:hypothetical protein HLPR_01470 [Clostridia bacterium S502]
MKKIKENIKMLMNKLKSIKEIFHFSIVMHMKKHVDKLECKTGDCNRNLHMRKKYARYHRFFLISPMFVLVSLIIIILANGGLISERAYPYIFLFLAFIIVKEIVSVSISRRIYNQILRPIEDLKKGFYDVSNGNYGVQIKQGHAPEIRELINAFNDMSKELESAEIEKQKYEENRKLLITNISHDLKTPITSINGFVDGILDGVANTEEKKDAYIKVIQQNARYMNRLIDDLLLYSKLDLQKLPFTWQSISISDYIREIFNELLLENEENGVIMKLTDDLSKKIILTIDPKQLTRAIRNIVNNAITYNNKDQLEINFILAKEDKSIVIKIKDNGPGMNQELVKRVFEQFYRGDNARTMDSGSSGLGLAITKEIIVNHKGTIELISELGRGTTMIIRLPLIKEASIE